MRHFPNVVTWQLSSRYCTFVPLLVETSSKCRYISNDRSSPQEVFLRKGVLKICSKFAGEHPCRSVISINCNFIKIALWCGCSPVNLLHIFRTPFSRNTSGWLHLSSTLSTFSFIDAHLSAVLYNVADCFELICVVFLCLFCIFSMY